MVSHRSLTVNGGGTAFLAAAACFLVLSLSSFTVDAFEKTAGEALEDLSSRSLLAKPTLTFQLLLTGLSEEEFDDDAKRDPFVEAIAELAGTLSSAVSVESTGPAPRSPTPVAACDTERYLCGSGNFVHRSTYLAVVQGDCAEYGDQSLFVCGRYSIKKHLYFLIKDGTCVCDPSAPPAKPGPSRRLLEEKDVESFVLAIKIVTDSNAEALAVKKNIGSSLKDSESWMVNVVLVKKGLSDISLKLLRDPEYIPAVIVNFWEVGKWGDCSVDCGGGTQSRRITCHSSDKRQQVGNWLCDHGRKPAATRSCNVFSCELSLLQFEKQHSKVSSCSDECGPGTKQTPVHCVGRDGYLGSLEYCPKEEFHGRYLTTSCNDGPCDMDTHWRIDSWGACNKRCGGGKMKGTRVCILSDGSVVEDHMCDGPSTMWKPCNTAPCDVAYWDIEPWGECDSPCGGGTMKRTVKCKNRDGLDLDESLCGTKPKVEARCNSQRCNFCAKNNCSKRGVCKNGACTCYQGFKGKLCELPDTCDGVLDKDKHCCDSGIIDRDGICCPANSLVSSDGECCDRLDAAGTCSGTAKYITIDDRECPTLLDSDGMCCTSGTIDDCGVCDGDSMSCATKAAASVKILDALNVRDGEKFDSHLGDFLAEILNVDPHALQIEEKEFIPDGSTSPVVRVGFELEPETLALDGNSLSSDVAWDRLESAVGKIVPGYGLFEGVSSVTREAVCGNKVCEAGERPIISTGVDDSQDVVGGCPEDCKLPYKQCPVGLSPPKGGPEFCSGHGHCHTASGQCTCWDGYTGSACDECDKGYIRSNSICVLQYTIEGVPLTPTDGASAFGQPLMVLGLAVSALAIIALVAGAVMLHRSRGDILSVKKAPVTRSCASKDPLNVARGLSFHAPRALSNPMHSPLSMGSRSEMRDPCRSKVSGASLHLALWNRGSTLQSEIDQGSRTSQGSPAARHRAFASSLLVDEVTYQCMPSEDAEADQSPISPAVEVPVSTVPAERPPQEQVHEEHLHVEIQEIVEDPISPRV
ncbi:hypothetical protein BSKO_05970 [Bryopsis sp. KO-2023]|nr:hypothetical protein BSKO_05970 [Bryopsis sp. KO-2023]